MTKALVLVDLQNEWIYENSEYYVGDLTDTLKRTNALIDFCRKKGYKIVFTRHIDGDSRDAFKPGDVRAELIQDLHLNHKDIIIDKDHISPFYKTRLESALRGVNDIIVGGILTNLCVRSLVEEAYDRGFNITVIEDCCVAEDEETQQFTLNDLKHTRDDIRIELQSEFCSK